MLPVPRSEAYAPDTLTYHVSRSVQCLYHVRSRRTCPLHNCDYSTLPSRTQIIISTRTLCPSAPCSLIYTSISAVTIFSVAVIAAIAIVVEVALVDHRRRTLLPHYLCFRRREV